MTDQAVAERADGTLAATAPASGALFAAERAAALMKRVNWDMIYWIYETFAMLDTDQQDVVCYVPSVDPRDASAQQTSTATGPAEQLSQKLLKPSLMSLQLHTMFVEYDFDISAAIFIELFLPRLRVTRGRRGVCL